MTTDQARTSWVPVDLAAVLANEDGLESPPSVLARIDGGCLLYAGKIHWFAGEPEAAKGWLALMAASELIKAGKHVLWVDFEDEASTARQPTGGSWPYTRGDR